MNGFINAAKKPPHYDLFPPGVTAPVCFGGQTPHREVTFGAPIQRIVSWLAKGLEDCRNYEHGGALWSEYFK